MICPFLVPISFQTKPRLRVAEQVDLCKFYEGLSLFSEGPRASSKRVPGRVPLTRELGLGYSLVVSLFKFEADMSRCLCYLKQLWSSKYWSPKTIGVSDQGWLWQWQTRLKIKYSIVMFLIRACHVLLFQKVVASLTAGCRRHCFVVLVMGCFEYSLLFVGSPSAPLDRALFLSPLPL